MMNLLGQLMGFLMRNIYSMLETVIPTEPEHFSYYAMAVVLTTIIFKLILIPLSIKQAKSTAQMQRLQPKILEMQKKYGNDQQTLARKQQELYKEENVSLFGGCLPMLIQLPIMLAFYRIFLEPTTYVFSADFYATMNKSFFWITDLSMKDPIFILPIIAAAATYLQSKVMQPPQPAGAGADQAAQMTNSMTMMMPIMIGVMTINMASGTVLYWAISNLFGIVQQKVVNKIVARENKEA